MCNSILFIIRLHLLTSIIWRVMIDWPLQIYFNFQWQSIFLKTNFRFNSIIKFFWHLTVVLQRFGTFWKSKKWKIVKFCNYFFSIQSLSTIKQPSPWISVQILFEVPTTIIPLSIAYILGTYVCSRRGMRLITRWWSF